MSRVIVEGSSDVRNDLPWYSRTTFVCARCGTQFKLDESDFIVSHGPFMGPSLDQFLYWRKFSTTATAGLIDSATLGTTGFQNTYYPDQIYGPCPFCGYMNTYVSADYGLVHPADASGVTPTVVGVLQSTLAAGAVSVTFLITTGEHRLVGVFLNASGAIWSQASGYATAITRIDATTLAPNYSFLLATPASPVSPAVARASDQILCGLLDRVGLAVV